MSDKKWMIYGANGYTGELIAREAAKKDMQPVLAGRNETQIAELANKLRLEYRIFSLDKPEQIAAKLNDVDVVLHCAGPFSATAKPMIEACLQSGTHYLDITGEISVFEYAQAQATRAKQAEVILCPGVGFDVIPTDCVAAALKAAMPDATHLALGFDSRSGFSPGTAKTTVEGMADGGRIRSAGQIVEVPLAYRTRLLDFGAGNKHAVTIPWGDVSTAWYTTQIPNIEVYIPATKKMITSMRRANAIRPLLKLPFVQWLLKRIIGRKVKGPNADQRRELTTHVWGEVSNAAGKIKSARLKCANGYQLTIQGSLAIVDHIRKTADISPGTYTPAKLWGKGLVSTLPGSSEIIVN